MTSNKQFMVSTHAGTEAVALEALARLVAIAPNAADILDEIEAKLIERFKNSELPAGHEMKMVEVVGPTLDEVKRLIKQARSKL